MADQIDKALHKQRRIVAPKLYRCHHGWCLEKAAHPGFLASVFADRESD